MDKSYGASRHSNTVCGRVRAGKLTQVSLSVGQHGAVAPALVRARIYLSAARSVTLLQAVVDLQPLPLHSATELERAV